MRCDTNTLGPVKTGKISHSKIAFFWLSYAVYLKQDFLSNNLIIY